MSDGRDEENWEVIDIAPDYLISDQGRVFYTIRERYLTTSYPKGKYPVVNLKCDGKPFSKAVHILVATAFVPGKAPGLVVNHIDGDKTNFSPDNLEWVTQAQNIQHAIETGLKPKERWYRTDENGNLVEFERKYYRSYKEEDE